MMGYDAGHVETLAGTPSLLPRGRGCLRAAYFFCVGDRHGLAAIGGVGEDGGAAPMPANSAWAFRDS